MASPLKHKWIVITRPQHQAKALQEKLEAAGANTILFPLLEIKAVGDSSAAREKLARIKDYDLVIFTSANAVTYALKWLDKNKLGNVAAIGKKTARLLESHAINVNFFPEQGFNSEALLAMPQIQSYAANKKIAILRGQNGRDFLKNGLQKQGAEVEYIDVYQRVFPQSNLEPLHQHLKNKQLDIILITSGNSLTNLFKFLAANEWLNKITLLLGSERIKAHLLKTYNNYQGTLLCAPDPSDETLYKELLSWATEVDREHAND